MHGSIQLDDLEDALSHAEFARNCWHEPAGRFLSPFRLADNTRLITVRRITCRCNHAMRLKIPNNAQWYSVPSYPCVFPSFSDEYSSFYQPMRERDTISRAKGLLTRWCLCCTCIASYVTQSNVARDEFIAGMLSAAYRGKRGVTSLPFHSMRSRCLLTFLQEDEQNRKEFARRQKRKPQRNVVVTAIIPSCVHLIRQPRYSLSIFK